MMGKKKSMRKLLGSRIITRTFFFASARKCVRKFLLWSVAIEYSVSSFSLGVSLDISAVYALILSTVVA